MAKIKITKKDGSPSPYYWSDDDGTEQTSKTVYKKTNQGVKRMKGVHFDAVTNRLARS